LRIIYIVQKRAQFDGDMRLCVNDAYCIVAIAVLLVVCHVVGITYQRIRKSVLQELLGSISGVFI